MPRAATTVAEAVSVLINSIDSGTSMSDGEDDPSDRVMCSTNKGPLWQQVSVFFGEACSDVVDGLGKRFTSDARFVCREVEASQSVGVLGTDRARLSRGRQANDRPIPESPGKVVTSVSS